MLSRDFGQAAERFLVDNMPLYRPSKSSPLKKRLFKEGFYIPSGGNCIARALLVLALSENVTDGESFIDLTLNRRGMIIHAKTGLPLPDLNLVMLVDTGAMGGLLGFGTTCIKYANPREVYAPGLIRSGRIHRVLKRGEVDPVELGIRTSMPWPEMSQKILSLANLPPATLCDG